MKIKTSELSGIVLDWAVAKCEGHTLIIDYYGEGVNDTFKLIHILRLTSFGEAYEPSSKWSIAGPIIEREGIEIRNRLKNSGRLLWAALLPDTYQLANSPLVAAMRCYVASKLGDEVDVPDELL